MEKIKFIKNNLLLLFILISSSVFSQTQDPTNAPYVGTWEYQNGNQIFRIILWEDSEPNPNDNKYYLKGDYEMVEVSNNTETVLYTSKLIDIPSQYQNAFKAFSGIVDYGSYHGTFREIHDSGSGLRGWFKIIYSSPTKISLEVTEWKGIRSYPTGTTPPTGFVVPNDIVLTKK